MSEQAWSQLLWGPLGAGGTLWWPLFWHFTALSLVAIGGAITTVAEMQRIVVVERGWLSAPQFNDCIAIGQATPGPNVLFVAAIGYSVAGLAGAAATMAGSLLPSALLAVGAGRVGDRYRDSPGVRAFTAGLAPLTLGLLLATGATLLGPVAAKPMAWVLVAGTLWLMLRTKRNPMWAIAVGALVGAVGWV
jgi:chromate transporter